MRTTSIPRVGGSRVTTAPAAMIGRSLPPFTDGRSSSFTGMSRSWRLAPCRSLGSTPALGGDQVLLHVHQGLTVGVCGVHVPPPVRIELPRGRAVVEAQLEQLTDLGHVSRVGDG